MEINNLLCGWNHKRQDLWQSEMPRVTPSCFSGLRTGHDKHTSINAACESDMESYQTHRKTTLSMEASLKTNFQRLNIH